MLFVLPLLMAKVEQNHQPASSDTETPSSVARSDIQNDPKGFVPAMPGLAEYLGASYCCSLSDPPGLG